MTENVSFELLERPLGSVSRHVIRHSSGAELEILSGMGGCVTGWRIPQNGTVLNLMEGYASEEELRSRFDSSHCGARLTPFPNRVCSGRWNYQGKNYELPCNFPWEQGHAIHGLLFNKPWTVASWHASDHFAVLTLEYRYKGTEAGFPFAFDAVSRYCMAQGSFQVETLVRNTGSETLPLGEGWHPYFGFGDSIDSLELQLPPSVHVLKVDDRSIPTGQISVDHTWDSLRPIASAQINTCWRIEPQSFEDSHAVVLLRCPKRGTIRYWQEQGPGQYQYLQLYTPPHRNYLAIEPMTCPPDVLNSHQDLIELEPNQKSSWAWGAEWDRV